MSTIISIGGTGAKIVESILHLSACGLLTEARENIRDELKIIFIDPDKSNGNLTRTTETLEGYQKVKKIIKDSPELFNIDIEILGNTVWSPILEDDKKTLANIFGKQRILDTPIYGLFDTLYSIDEQEAKLDDGFLGRPSIGSAIIAQYLDFEAEPWKSLTKHIDSEIGDDGKRISKVFIIGSIFGGTGASGFPTLAKLLKKENEKNGNNFKLGGLLVFPYFRFEASNDPGKLAAKSKYFTITSKIALEYYHNQNFYDNFDALYLIGDNKRELMEKSKPGGAEQKNKANIIELYSGLSALDFLFSTVKDLNSTKRNKAAVIARHEDILINWDDFNLSKMKESKEHLSKFTRFSLFFLTIVFPFLYNPENKNSVVPWYVKYFKNFEIDRKHLKNIQSYLEYYLVWLKDISNHEQYTGGINLFKTELYKFEEYANDKDDKNINDNNGVERSRLKFDYKQIKDIEKDSDKVHSFRTIWNKICASKSVSLTSDNALGKFLEVLYKAC